MTTTFSQRRLAVNESIHWKFLARTSWLWCDGIRHQIFKHIPNFKNNTNHIKSNEIPIPLFGSTILGSTAELLPPISSSKALIWTSATLTTHQICPLWRLLHQHDPLLARGNGRCPRCLRMPILSAGSLIVRVLAMHRCHHLHHLSLAECSGNSPRFAESAGPGLPGSTWWSPFSVSLGWIRTTLGNSDARSASWPAPAYPNYLSYR